jgi:hypothetical protein
VYGGKFAFEHGMSPRLDKEIRGVLAWVAETEVGLPAGPMKWIANEDGRRTAVAVGRVAGKPRHLPIATLSL